MADFEPKSGHITYRCTMCHKYKHETPDNILVHVCSRRYPALEWHYVPNCVTLICEKCIVKIQ